MSSSEPPVTEVVTLKLSPPLAIITLNNPKKLNALSRDAYYRLSCLLQDVAVDPSITTTILTGTGRFFSAGADVSASRPVAPDPSDSSSDPSAVPAHHVFRQELLRGLLLTNFEVTRSFYMHPKILVTALNGPVIGLSAALIGFSDFIYATPSTYLLAPFSSLGLVAEGGASIGFVSRLGISLANEALIMSKRIPMDKLLSSGFVNKEFPGDEDFLENVLAEVRESLGPHLNGESLVKIKALIREKERNDMEAQGTRELVGAVERFVQGTPQEEFRKLASGEKKHKL